MGKCLATLRSPRLLSVLCVLPTSNPDLAVAQAAAEQVLPAQAPSADQPLSIERPGPEIIIGDDRPARLRTLTNSWNTNWELQSINYQDILSGGPPRDSIPSIDSPQFDDQTAAAAWLADNEPVIVLEIDGDARACPLPVVTWHEIVNDTVGGIPVVVTFCPLCNSAPINRSQWS